MNGDVHTAPRSQKEALGFWLFLVLAAIYLLSYSGGFHAIDEVSVAAMTENLVKYGQVNTDQIWWSQGWTPSQGREGPGGHLYSKKGLGSALLGSSFYWLSLHVPAIGGARALMLANGLVTALTGWLLYDTVLRLKYEPAAAVITALGYGLGTMAWPYAKYFFSEPLTALGLVLGIWGLSAVHDSGEVRYAVAAGLGLGLALLAKVANLITWPLFLIYGFGVLLGREGRARQARSVASEAGGVERRVRLLLSVAAFLLSLVAAVAVLIAYNVVRTGSPLDLGYDADETFSTPLASGLAGLLLSPGKSLFLYSPLLIASLLGIPALLRRNRAVALLSLAVGAAYTLLYARWYMWWGGWSWGPRFLVPVLPFLALFFAPVVDWAWKPSRIWGRISLAGLGLVSVAVQILGIAVDFNQYLLLLHGRGIDSAEVNFRIDLSPLGGHWTLLRQRVWDLVWAGDAAQDPHWSLLVWPLALLASALAGGYFVSRSGWPGHEQSRLRAGQAGSPGKAWGALQAAVPWVVVVLAIGLWAASAGQAARLAAPADDWQAGCDTLTETMQEVARPHDIMVIDLLPYAPHLDRTVALLERYKARVPYLGWERQEPILEGRRAQMAALGRDHRRLWLVLDTTPEADPASTTERWLDEHAFRVESSWLSPAMRLVRYQLASGELSEIPRSALDMWLGGRLRLTGLTAFCHDPAGHVGVEACPSTDPIEAHSGGVLPFSLFWQAAQPVEQDYVVFVHLLDQGGGLRAQVDRPPVSGFRPTSTWQVGELVRDNYGLALPAELPPGRYQLIAGLFLPGSMERLEVRNAEGVGIGDFALLAEVIVAPGEGS